MAREQNLRAWLRAQPQPTQLRIRKEDGAELIVELSATAARNKWKNAEEAVRASRAIAVECLDKKGNILRARELEVADDDDEAETAPGGKNDPYKGERERLRKALTDQQREFASVLDRYGDRLNEAFERGSNASAASHDALVGLVSSLTDHFSHSISNMHTMSVNLANAIAQMGQLQGGEGGSDNGAMLGNLIALALGRQVPMQGAPPPAAGATPPPNGGKK